MEITVWLFSVIELVRQPSRQTRSGHSWKLMTERSKLGNIEFQWEITLTLYLYPFSNSFLWSVASPCWVSLPFAALQWLKTALYVWLIACHPITFLKIGLENSMPTMTANRKYTTFEHPNTWRHVSNTAYCSGTNPVRNASLKFSRKPETLS